MKLTVDCALTHQLSSLQSTSALARLLSAAVVVTQSDIPLEVLACQQYGLEAKPDFPIAAISAAADGLDIASVFWLRADPVYLAMQRDCFSLGEPTPLPVEATQARVLVDHLNQHFSQDGLIFHIGKSGAWYIQSQHTPEIKTTLPCIAAGKNIHPFLPQGADAGKWRATLNEVQMLLHDHPVNLARESAGELAINSVWFSGGGVLPDTFQQAKTQMQAENSLMIADEIFYQGLAKWAGIPLQPIPNNLDTLLLKYKQHRHVRLQLPEVADLDDTWFNALSLALKHNDISMLTLNLGFYETSINAEIKPSDVYFYRYKFWRKPKSVMQYLS